MDPGVYPLNTKSLIGPPSTNCSFFIWTKQQWSVPKGTIHRAGLFLSCIVILNAEMMAYQDLGEINAILRDWIKVLVNACQDWIKIGKYLGRLEQWMKSNNWNLIGKKRNLIRINVHSGPQNTKCIKITDTMERGCWSRMFRLLQSQSVPIGWLSAPTQLKRSIVWALMNKADPSKRRKIPPVLCSGHIYVISMTWVSGRKAR